MVDGMKNGSDTEMCIDNKHEDNLPHHFEKTFKMQCKILGIEWKDNLSTASFPSKLLESINI